MQAKLGKKKKRSSQEGTGKWESKGKTVGKYVKYHF